MLSKIKRGRKGEKGAQLVEFAVLAPLLILLLLGIIELGYKFAQFNELRHGVREGARYAAVSEPDLDGGGVGNSDVVKAVCDAIDLPGVTLKTGLQHATPSDTYARLDYATITVEATVSSLTGAPIITSFIPSTLTNAATFRLEQDAGWKIFKDEDCP